MWFKNRTSHFEVYLNLANLIVYLYQRMHVSEIKKVTHNLVPSYVFRRLNLHFQGYLSTKEYIIPIHLLLYTILKC
jgi:hypothetical protein